MAAGRNRTIDVRCRSWHSGPNLNVSTHAYVQSHNDSPFPTWYLDLQSQWQIGI